MSFFPKNCTLTPNPWAKRMSGKQVANLLRACVLTDLKIRINIRYRSAIMFDGSTKWREVRGDGYTFIFVILSNGSVGNCVFARTPKGVEYLADEAGPGELTCQCLDWGMIQLIDHAVTFDPSQETISVEPYTHKEHGETWRVVLNAGKDNELPISHMQNKGGTECGIQFPKMLEAGNWFKDRRMAETALERFSHYWEKLGIRGRYPSSYSFKPHDKETK